MGFGEKVRFQLASNIKSKFAFLMYGLQSRVVSIGVSKCYIYQFMFYMLNHYLSQA